MQACPFVLVNERYGDISIVEAPSLRAPEYTGGRLEERPRKLFMSESLTPLESLPEF